MTNPRIRTRLHSLLAPHEDMQVVGERGDGLSALEAFTELAPHLVFLDIQIPGMNGLEVAEARYRTGSPPVIIFVTAYDQFALEAFRLNALDYITKPIEPERFSEALNRAREHLKAKNRDEIDKRMQAMLEMYERKQSARPHIVVREQDRYLLVSTADIQAIEATGNYVCLHCERTNHVLRSSLSAIEIKLDPQRFVRIHRSWIVNLDHVREAQPWAKGTWILQTHSKLKIPVGHQYRDVMKNIF